MSDDYIIEKEYNGMLIDQLAMLERLERQAQKSGDQEMLEAIAIEKSIVNQKLYQTPPIQK